MRATITLRLVAATVLLLAGILLPVIASGGMSTGRVSALPFTQAVCTVGDQLVRNGTFTDGPANGWAGISVVAPDGGGAGRAQLQLAGSGSLVGANVAFSQSIAIGAYAGAVLAFSVNDPASPEFSGATVASATLGDATISLTPPGTGTRAGEVSVPSTVLPSDSLTLRIAAQTGFTAYIDNASLTVVSCGAPTPSPSAPDATASASVAAASASQAAASGTAASDVAVASAGTVSQSAGTASALAASASSAVASGDAVASGSAAAASASTAAIPSPRPFGVRPDRSPRPGAVALPSPSPASARPDRSPRPAR